MYTYMHAVASFPGRSLFFWGFQEAPDALARLHPPSLKTQNPGAPCQTPTHAHIAAHTARVAVGCSCFRTSHIQEHSESLSSGSETLCERHQLQGAPLPFT